jgi:hypothetical protein
MQGRQHNQALLNSERKSMCCVLPNYIKSIVSMRKYKDLDAFEQFYLFYVTEK